MTDRERKTLEVLKAWIEVARQDPTVHALHPRPTCEAPCIVAHTRELVAALESLPPSAAERYRRNAMPQRHVVFDNDPDMNAVRETSDDYA